MKILAIALFITAFMSMDSAMISYAGESDLIEARLNYEIYSEGNYQFRAEFSSLYRRDAEGNLVDARWYRDEDLFRNGNNHFDAMVQTENISVWNSQVNGDWSAKPFIKGKEVKLKGISIHSDRLNENYKGNVLYYDYGQFRREVRIIEGMLTSTWVFEKEPDGDIFIEIKKSGNIKFRKPRAYDKKGFDVRVEDALDGERIDLDVLKKVDYPLYLNDSPETFYPDAHEEETSVDGFVSRYYTDGESWASLRTGAGTEAAHSGTGMWIYILSRTDPNWGQLARPITLFDSTALPDLCSISGGKILIMGREVNGGWEKRDDCNIEPGWNIYSANPASNTTLIAADYLYTNFGTTAFSSTVTYENWAAGEYNEFVLNASGKAAISKTGISKFSSREPSYDADGTPPTHPGSSGLGSFLNAYTADKGSGYEPKLIVWYDLEPDIPENFYCEQIGVDKLSCTWVDDERADNTAVFISFNEEDYYMTYNGTAETCNITGLDLNSTVYYLSAYSQNLCGSSGITTFKIGGADMELTAELGFPAGFYGLFAGLAIMFINFFLKKGLLYLAIIPCMIATLVEPAFKDAWFQSGCVLVMIWAAIAFFKSMQERSIG